MIMGRTRRCMEGLTLLDWTQLLDLTAVQT
jgi:hypothetical protein